MDEARWKVIERLYEEVYGLSAGARADFWATRTDVSAELAREVEALLNAQEHAEGFFGDLHEAVFMPEASPAERDSFVGRKVAHYEVAARIGSGGMGIVYHARDTRLNRDVALKVLPPHLNADAEAKQRFLIEAQAASRLSHPHVATVYGVEDLEGGQLAMIMTYCPGGSLKVLLKSGPLPLEEAVEKAMQIAAGLEAAHEKGIIHRDVKPGNIMLGEGGQLQIVDFGLARISGLSGITRTGMTMGTATYMAPEIVRGSKGDHRVDIWSLGVVLYEMVAGKAPFAGEHLHSKLYALVNEPPIPIAGLRPGIPSQLEYAIYKALEKEPASRYADMDALRRDLQAVLDKKTTIDVKPGTKMTAGPERNPSQVEPDGPVNILVVDDEPDIELLIRQYFLKKIRAGEWAMFFAENGEAALRRIEEIPGIKVILTDIHMPVMDGLTLLSRLAEKGGDQKAVVVSAYGDMQNIRRAMNLGAFDFVTKPIQFHDLETTIYKAVREYDTIDQARSARRRLSGLENELMLAKNLQQSVLPRQWPQSDEVSVYAYMEPAPEINGDFYDFFYLDDDRLGFFVGDVSGRALPAAMYMAMCRTLLKADARRGLSPSACMMALNEFVQPKPVDGIFITVFYGVLDVRSGRVTYCNAGYNPPFMLGYDGNVEQTSWRGGVGIGVLETYAYTDEQLDLGPADALLLFSDGLLKSKNAAGELYPEARCMSVLEKFARESPSHLIRMLVRDVSEFTRGAEQADDMTYLAVRRTAG